MDELYYCAASNRKFAEIAISGGFQYGAQLPNTVYFAPQFVDQDWGHPNFERYTSALRANKPHLASVLDWEREEQFSEVMQWAEEAAGNVDTVIIIPKVIGGVKRIPEKVGGKPVRLGYSVPTRYGGTPVPLWEFGKRPVHLLGGSPHKQMRLSQMLNAVSADGNYIQKAALEYGMYWVPGNAPKGYRYFCRLDDTGERWGHGMPYEAFARSVENVLKAWQLLKRGDYSELPLFGGMLARKG